MKLALVAAWNNKPWFRNNIMFYLKELKKYYDDVWIIYNNRPVDSKEITRLNFLWIKHRWYEEVGYDFGKRMLRLQAYDISKYDEVLLTNDSCYLLSPKKFEKCIDWVESRPEWVYWLTDAYTCHVAYQTHWWICLNSTFLHFKWKKAIDDMKDYLTSISIPTTKNEVIEKWEFGLDNWIRTKGHNIECYISVDYLIKQYWLYRYTTDQWWTFTYNPQWELNPIFDNFDLVYREWYPFLKWTIKKYYPKLEQKLHEFLVTEIYNLQNEA